jgi:hypothetical protein
MLVMFSVVPPLFVSVTAWALLVLPSAWLGNVILGGDKFGVGCATPVPDSEMLIVGPQALVVIDMVPVTLPPTAGANLTLKVALSKGFRVRDNTSPLMLKPAPVTVARETVTLRVPVFVRVTPRVRLVPTVTLPKLRLLELVAIRVNAAASLARLRATKNRSTERTSCAKRPAHAYFRRFFRRHRQGIPLLQGSATVPSRQEACASVFGSLAEATGTLTGDGKPLHVQIWLSAECFVTLRVREGRLDRGKNCPLFYDLRNEATKTP